MAEEETVVVHGPVGQVGEGGFVGGQQQDVHVLQACDDKDEEGARTRMRRW